MLALEATVAAKPYHIETTLQYYLSMSIWVVLGRMIKLLIAFK